MDKVIWALDAFTEDLRLHKKAASLLKAWSKLTPIAIEPVYVMSPDQLNVPPGIFALLKSQNQTEIERRLNGLLKKADIDGAVEPTLLVSDAFSLSQAVQTLLTHARKSKAIFILVGTHAKKGANRFLFGSFAENLVLQSEIPVFLVSPKTDPSELKHVLFATDLREPSREAFRTLVSQAKKRHFEITLYNKFEFFVDYTLAPLLGTNAYQQVMDKDLARRECLAQDLVLEAEREGVQVRMLVDQTSLETNVATSILHAAEKTGADSIAMASQSGKVASSILGSVTRQLIRGASYPIWIMHPETQL